MPISTLRSTFAWPAGVGDEVSAGQAFVESNTANVDLLTFQRAGE